MRARLAADREHKIDGVLLTHNETSTGVQNDMAALAAAIGDHPATTVVDSVSGLGATQFEMDAWGYDIVVAASQKALAVPPGMAMVAVSKRGWERIAAAKSPKFYLDLTKARDFAALGQTPWTPPVSILFALDVAIERYHADGAANVCARHERYARALRAAMAALDLELFSHPGAHSVTVVAVKVPDHLKADEIRRALREEAAVVIGGGQQELKGKIIRIGTMGALTQTDILGAIGALEIVLLQQGHPLQIGAGVRAALEVFLGKEVGARLAQARMRGYVASAAFLSALMSSLTASASIAFITLAARAGSSSAKKSPMLAGSTCHDRPNLSVSQPHLIFSPPAESFSHSSSISVCVSQFKMNEIACEK